MLALDFDGTIAEHSNFEGMSVVGEPMQGALDFISQLHQMGYRLAIFSARAGDPAGKRAIEQWVIEHDLRDVIEFVTPLKLPIFDLIIDDRAIKFDGSYRDVMKQIIKSGRGK